MHDQLYSFSCLSKGDHRYAYNIMQGKVRDRPILAFDWHYELGGDGKNETHNDHYFSAVIVQPGVVLKPLLIRSETFFDKIGEVFGLGAIELESAEFNRRFHVTSPDRRWAFDVLPQTTMEFLLASPHFTLEIQDFCILAHTGSVFSTAEFESALSVLNGFLDRIPPSVIQDLKDVHA